MSSVSGMSHANSSPPTRASTSPLRTWVERRPATSHSTRSPTWWPWLSLTRLKWSRSITARASGRPCRWARATSSSRRSWKTRWFARPVSGSLEACAASSRRAWAFSIASCTVSATRSRRSPASGANPPAPTSTADTAPQRRPSTRTGTLTVGPATSGGSDRADSGQAPATTSDPASSTQVTRPIRAPASDAASFAAMAMTWSSGVSAATAMARRRRARCSAACRRPWCPVTTDRAAIARARRGREARARARRAWGRFRVTWTTSADGPQRMSPVSSPAAGRARPAMPVRRALRSSPTRHAG